MPKCNQIRQLKANGQTFLLVPMPEESNFKYTVCTLINTYSCCKTDKSTRGDGSAKLSHRL